MLSKSQAHYIKAVYELSSNCDNGARVCDVAEKLNVSKASAIEHVISTDTLCAICRFSKSKGCTHGTSLLTSGHVCPDGILRFSGSVSSFLRWMD